MAGERDILKAAMTQNTTVIGSAVTLIQGLKAKDDAAIVVGGSGGLDSFLRPFQ